MAHPDPRDLPQGPLETPGVYPAPTRPVRKNPPPRPRRLRATAWWAGFALAGVAFAAVMTIWFARAANEPAITSAPERAAASGAEPKTLDAAKAAAQRAVDRFASGDAAGAWDLMSTAAKGLITKADYVAFYSACPSRGVTFEVGEVRFDAPDRVLAIVKSALLTSALNLVYEVGAWRWQPLPELAADWGMTVKDRVAAAKADGTCGS